MRQDRTLDDNGFRPPTRLVIHLHKLHNSRQLRDFRNNKVFIDERERCRSPNLTHSGETFTKSERPFPIVGEPGVGASVERYGIKVVKRCS